MPPKKAAAKQTAKSSKPAIKKISKSPAKKLATADSKGLKIGDKAPLFSLPGHKGDISLKDLRGSKVIVYFYPKDDTSGCTKEACTFQENISAFNKADAVVIGISKDSLASHEKFAKKYKLGFNLGSDEDTKVAAAYGAWIEKSMYGRKYMGIDRSTFLIDEKGVLQGVWRKVSVPGHVEEVLAAAKKL